MALVGSQDMLHKNSTQHMKTRFILLTQKVQLADKIWFLAGQENSEMKVLRQKMLLLNLKMSLDV